MLGNIIEAVGNVAGGLFNAKKQEKFAKNALQWKAADAEKAGISKIFAMGAPTHSFSPVSIGSNPGLGNSINSAIAGQGTGAGSTTTGKVSGISAGIAQAQLTGLNLDNDIKRAELASKVSVATQPGAGGLLDRDVTQGPAGTKFENKVAPSGHLPHKSYGVSPEVDLYRTHSGYAPQVPQQLQEAFENDALGRWQWNIRNRLQPTWNMDAYGTPPNYTPDGKYWMYNPVLGQYVAYPNPGNGRAPMRDAKDVFDRLRR